MDSAGDDHHHDHYLKQMNKFSHKISKPIKRKVNPSSDFNPQKHYYHQPPQVYNINKKDFRDVVQKLTACSSSSSPKPPTSRLQAIRPLPLSLINTIPSPPPPILPLTTTTTTTTQDENGRKITTLPLSPLPPFPVTHFAMESPVSAYMRFLRSSTPTSEFESKKEPKL